MPACAATTPAVAACLTQTPLTTHFNAATHQVVADITLPKATTTTGTVPATRSLFAAPAAVQAASAPMVLAATTTSAGGGGDYTATSLNPSSGWAAGGTGGGMTYSYPIQVPPALGGTAPSVALSYNSSSVDGETSATNTQASWIGDGWNYSPGFIERTYKSCSKDGITGSGDLCWGGYNATLSLGSHSGPLVRDDATGTWRIKGDDGTKVEFATDNGSGKLNADNTTDNHEYVKVTDTSGTVYYFGLNHLPGGNNTDPATNSVSTAPVYSPNPAASGNPADPCYDSAKGQASVCRMATRWSLDYVVDAHGNLTTYTYAPETGYYTAGGGQNNGTGTPIAYTRANLLQQIAYGQRLTDQVAANGTLQAAARVKFDATTERCIPVTGFTCDPSLRTTANAANWPDTPIDQECPATGTCTHYSPTFFSTKRLTTITTQVRSNNVWLDVDSYTLAHSFRDPGDTTSQRTLWLDSVQRTGKTATPSVTLPW